MKIIRLLCLVLFFCGGYNAFAETDAFRLHCAELAAEAAGQGQTVVTGRDGWLFLTAELRHMGLGKFWGDAAPAAARAGVRPEHADPLPAILDFHEQLKSMDVNLLLVPVPAKCLVFPDMLPDAADKSAAPADFPTASAHAEFYALLREHGIKVLDLVGLFRENRDHEQGTPYCRQDTHWSGNGCVLAAQAIADMIRPDLNTADAAALTGEWRSLEIRGDLARMLADTDLPPEKVMVRRIGRQSDTGLIPLESDPAAPVILLGDSHNLVFNAGGDMHASGAGLPDQLALELGQPVELVAVRGSGATPARINLYRRAARNPEYWQGRRWVIWCFAAREFTESDGWRKVPVRPNP